MILAVAVGEEASEPPGEGADDCKTVENDDNNNLVGGGGRGLEGLSYSPLNYLSNKPLFTFQRSYKPRYQRRREDSLGV
eukprot:scaffold10709_cov78-Skeletonema_dohrnii-CCMP3373.AAC.2